MDSVSERNPRISRLVGFDDVFGAVTMVRRSCGWNCEGNPCPTWMDFNWSKKSRRRGKSLRQELNSLRTNACLDKKAALSG